MKAAATRKNRNLPVHLSLGPLEAIDAKLIALILLFIVFDLPKMKINCNNFKSRNTLI